MQQSNKKYKILVSGGGTGGHIFPAVSIANEIKRRFPDSEFLFIGANGRMEMEKVPAAGYKIIGLPVTGFDRKNMLKNIKVALNLYKSMRQARNILKEYAPDIAIGVGGYVSGPVLKEAQKLGIPTLIQEQNSYAGVTNKLLAKEAKAICVAYEGMDKFFPADKIILTGNPVRRNMFDCNLTAEEARRKFELNPGIKTILVVGGSLGARTVNNSIIAGLKKIATDAEIQVIWQSGKIYNEQAAKALSESGAENVKQMPFIADMGSAYAAADLVVSRAGASSISELQLLGKPCILIPSPNVAEDHQTKNALALVNKNAAIMVKDIESVDSLVDTMIATVKDDALLHSLSENVLKMALKNADEKIVDNVETIIENRKKK